MALDENTQQHKEELLTLTGEVLATEQYVAGSVICQHLSEIAPESVGIVKASLGGKGWLKKLLIGVNDIQQVHINGVDEPCFSSLGDALDKSLIDTSRSAAKGKGKGKGKAKGGVSPAFSAKGGELGRQPPHMAAVRAGGGDSSELLSSVIYEVLGGVEYLSGSKLTKELGDRAADLVNVVKASLGGKGWLKKFLASDAAVQLVEVPGVDEPCFALSGQPPSARLPLRGPKLAATRMPGAGPPAVPLNGRFALASHRPLGGKGATASQVLAAAILAKKRGGEQAGADVAKPAKRQRVESIPASFPQEKVEVIIATAVEILSNIEIQPGAQPRNVEGGFLEGSKLSTLLKEQAKSEVDDLMEEWQTEFGKDRDGRVGKGWMKLLLAKEPSITMIRVDGLDEPCFSLANPFG
eukprot:TRINITY_DN11737_c3_g1_i1.p1 TRINITY_DN11737_c3_g1~~TRINITY_DN11737_c3_g1_i1.p1  ORF type:complete len:410 (-),score=95.68 TRINITY_DN11737_c3_g1_i1:58-1287(-)